MNQILLCILLFLMTCVLSAEAGISSKVINESVEVVMKQFGKEAAKEGAEVLTKKATTLAAKHGDDGIKAFQKCGPMVFRYVEEAGANGEIVVKLLAKRGDDAVWVVQKNNRVAIFAKYGDDAAEAMIKHKEIVEQVIESLGKPAATALSKVSSQNARRLAMMVGDGELAKIGRSDELLGVVGKYGDSAMSFIWNNKGALATATVLAAFLATPEPFINGGKDLASVLAEKVAEPIARNTNWTLLIVIFGGMAVLYFGLLQCLKQLRSTKSP
ncbi:MAG: hypothetical protein ACRCUY_03300 [Thermoguttaceae bacterium]